MSVPLLFFGMLSFYLLIIKGLLCHKRKNFGLEETEKGSLKKEKEKIITLYDVFCPTLFSDGPHKYKWTHTRASVCVVS